MAGTAVDIAHLRGWIGREEAVEDILTADLARKYHAMFDLPGKVPQSGDVAAPLIHFCLAQPAAPTAGLGPDGHPARGGFLPPVPLPRRMWAGGSLAFTGTLKVGDAITRRSRIEDVTLKEGRTGSLCFVTVSHHIVTGGATVIEERQDIVYREMEGGAAAPAKPATQVAPGAHSVQMKLSTPMLFRYSALTFNGHRIHYDRPYTTGVEGYPGLVVHGPMQAAFLINHAGRIRGRPPARFSFRGLSPLFDHESFSVNAEDEGGKLRLWTAKDGGPVCMSAEAEW
jgi:3-methylfumaryl-CoA hydratase